MPNSSRKVYVDGVPMREITLAGDNPPLRLYDTSGPYTDPAYTVDLKPGLPTLRREWVRARGDVEPGRVGRRARPGRRVTQLHYARRGELTPEMEFVATREGVGPGRPRSARARGRRPRGSRRT